MEIGPMSSHEREQLLKVMAQSINAFAKSESDIGCFKGFEYKLELKHGAEAQFTPQFPLPMEKQKEVNIWMEKMYREKVITRTDLGKWQSPSFVVPKKTGKWVNGKWVPKTRFVVDFRKVNEQLIPDWLPAKPISHILAEVQASGAKYFSTIDIQSAFFSIKYDPNTVEPTAFYADCGNNVASNGECLTGRWKFLRMIMGAQHSSSALFRAMSMILRGLPFVKVYCDDLLIYTKTREEHIKALGIIFARIAKFGVKLAAAKCNLLKTKLPFLGYVISGDQITPAEDKIAIVRNMLPPTTVKEIRKVLGFFNFFRMFIPNYSYFSSRLSGLTRKNGTWKEKTPIPEGSLKAFKHLKDSLLRAPTLNNPDPTKAFFLFTDASKGGAKFQGMIAWGVMQKGERNNQWNPIMFGGRSIRSHEENYPINQLEQAAIVEGYKDNYHLLFGRETYIYCDNKPSIERAAKTEKSFFGILQDLISQTNSKVYYLPGNKQIMADFLSRYHAPQIMSVDEPIINQTPYLNILLQNKQMTLKS